MTPEQKPPSPTHRVRKHKKRAKQTLDLEVAINLAGRQALVVASSKPSPAPPPLTEVPPLNESGVVGLARVDDESEPFLLLVIITCLDEERRCLTLQSTLKASTAPSFAKSAAKRRRRRRLTGGGGGCCSGWFSFKRSSTTKVSSFKAT
jgi:hypothetical protein